MGHADQFPVGKHGARALVAVVQDHVHACGQELGVQRLSGGLDLREAVRADGTQGHGKRRQRVRPDDAARVVVLLNRGGGQAGNADAVATHFHGLGLAVDVQKGGVHDPAVFGAKVKDLADLNAALNGQHAAAIGRQVARHHVADVVHHIGLGQVPAPVHTADMKVNFVGAANPVAHQRHLAVGHDAQRLLEAHRPQVTRLAAKVRVNLRQRGKPKIGQARNLANLHLVHAAVAAQQQQPDLGLDDLTRRVALVSGNYQRFERALQRQTQILGHIRAGAFARRCHFGQRCCGRGAWTGRSQRFRLFHIGGVFAAGGVGNGVFTRGSNHLKLFAQIAANGTAVGGHNAVGQTKAVKNAAVGLGHHLVTGLGTIDITVKAVGVLHGEFAATHQAKAWAAFVAEFGLNLVEILGQLLVALDFLARNVGHHLFAGGLQHKVARVPVFDAQQLGAHLVKAAGFLPQLGRLHHRHAEFNRTGAVHFLAHDGLHLADHAQAHGHVGVNTGT